MVGARRHSRELTTSRGRPSRRLRLALLLVALLTAGGVLATGGLLVDGMWRTADLTTRWKAAVAALPPPTSGSPTQQPPPVMEPRGIEGVDFALKVPRLGFYTAVASEGRGVNPFGPPAHTGGTWPGLSGDVSVDARGACFLSLAGLHAGDDVVAETLYGTYFYRIAETEPAKVGRGSTLTLSVCASDWVGRGPTLVAVLRGGIA